MAGMKLLDWESTIQLDSFAITLRFFAKWDGNKDLKEKELLCMEQETVDCMLPNFANRRVLLLLD